MTLNEEQLYKLKDECYTCFVTKNEVENILNNYNLLDRGSFASCYIDNNGQILKKYFSNPHLDSAEDGSIVFNYKNVIDNLIEISRFNQENSAIPTNFYVYNNDLIMYKAPFMKGDKLELISYLKKDLPLDDLKSAWLYGYYLARFYASKKITMYDLNPDNCNIYNGQLNIYDLDFYKKESDKRFILLNNYEIINKCFVNFFERYYFEFCYETNLKMYYSNSFCEEFFDELQNKSNTRCKTLKEVGKYL